MPQVTSINLPQVAYQPSFVYVARTLENSGSGTVISNPGSGARILLFSLHVASKDASGTGLTFRDSSPQAIVRFTFTANVKMADVVFSPYGIALAANANLECFVDVGDVISTYAITAVYSFI